MKELTPKEIVTQLDKYIIGQNGAKKSVAVALRNRYRRSLLDDEFKEEVKPKNILMVGPTGVGKTEIARRLAKLVKAPFIKVEATKFTEVGYVGRDVDSMIRDLLETSIRMVKSEKVEKVYSRAKELADEKIIKILAPNSSSKDQSVNPLETLFGGSFNGESKVDDADIESIVEERKRIAAKLRNKELEDQLIEIEVEENNNSTIEMLSGTGLDELNINFNDLFGGLIPGKVKKRKVTIKEARRIISEQEAQKLIDIDDVVNLGIKRAEEHGIIFIDEIDKVAIKGHGSGPDVSREGVQRDILPIIEGSTVMTKYGPVRTDHILFIGAGAFHVAKVTDLIPEIQGRFPIRVNLENLTEENFKEILIKPQNAIIKQYQLLLKTEGINIEFSEKAIEEIARIAFILNEETENIGARRLHTLLEKLLEDISFHAPDIDEKNIEIDDGYVKEKIQKSSNITDVSKYII
ncbi:ATP-dependent protease, ATP-binding subunit HslU [Gottschalkia acidurici 9a]|uniref:ATP-dependent protease ATPase subunit HslU n=1 Tax=Gottschalkia acidurici (strain ATCC 7906 / DSM 604 / BCRC 14475 / CIP 104303 / KCTC 5404 / NCIMB 10678 / 9a) TaxID=1128398 RepID=K0B1P0_GOTA9|nr:ATP-dependent protease ATPase subunit HslU [Gottschalkia acidurici]AFS78616.1 ATP-dependent protease, ATP-binding subunit HslU [Gottschalkia acidurici 9a]